MYFTSYEKLVRLCPDVVDYKMQYAQCLYKAGDYQASQKVASEIDDPNYVQRVSAF